MTMTTPPFADDLDGETVAAYETVHGAALAAEQLGRAGFAAEDVAILPVATHPLPGWNHRVTQRTHPSIVVLAALVGFGVALAVMLRWTESATPISTFVSVVSGLGCGAAMLVVDAHWVAGVRVAPGQSGE